MPKRTKSSSTSFILMILSLTFMIIFGSGFYLWFAVPEETAININGEKRTISTDSLLGTILQTSLEQ